MEPHNLHQIVLFSKCVLDELWTVQTVFPGPHDICGVAL